MPKLMGNRTPSSAKGLATKKLITCMKMLIIYRYIEISMINFQIRSNKRNETCINWLKDNVKEKIMNEIKKEMEFITWGSNSLPYMWSRKGFHWRKRCDPTIHCNLYGFISSLHPTQGEQGYKILIK